MSELQIQTGKFRLTFQPFRGKFVDRFYVGLSRLNQLISIPVTRNLLKKRHEKLIDDVIAIIDIC